DEVSPSRPGLDPIFGSGSWRLIPGYMFEFGLIYSPILLGSIGGEKPDKRNAGHAEYGAQPINGTPAIDGDDGGEDRHAHSRPCHLTNQPSRVRLSSFFPRKPVLHKCTQHWVVQAFSGS